MGAVASVARCFPSSLGILISLAAAIVIAFAPPASAEEAAAADDVKEREAIALPTRTDDEDDDDLTEDAASVDALVMATLQDLGFAVDLGTGHRAVEEHDLAALARTSDKLVVGPSLRRLSGAYELTIVAAHPGSTVLRMRVVRVDPAELQVKAVAMVRDVVTAEPTRPAPVRSDAKTEVVVPTKSEGRAILAVNGTVFGGFLGYSIQRSSGSDDPRLLYPLMAVGSGLGLGAAIIVSDEWDVTMGEAWFLTAGTWWPAAASHLIHAGRFESSTVDDEAWTFGLIGSVAGVTLSTALLLDHGMGDGGAVLAHSGGATGMVIGGLVDMGISGIHDAFPLAGMGYGAAGGWLVASSVAVLWEPDATDVLIVDLGVLLGGLAGASAASPLLFDEPDADKTRGWVGATGGGLLVGGTIAMLVLPNDETATPAWWRAVPGPSLVGLPPRLGEIAVPGYGLRWHGAW